jgi:hypothetical protein
VPFYMRYMRWPLAYNGHSLTDYVRNRLYSQQPTKLMEIGKVLRTVTTEGSLTNGILGR